MKNLGDYWKNRPEADSSESRKKANPRPSAVAEGLGLPNVPGQSRVPGLPVNRYNPRHVNRHGAVVQRGRLKAEPADCVNYVFVENRVGRVHDLEIGGIEVRDRIQADAVR